MAEEYIGSCISLISKYDIRYEGVICHISPKDSTIALKYVKSYGTEGRKKDGPQIPPGDKVYEYILFRGSDIKDLQVKSSPPTQKEEEVHNDPAIMQSQSPAAPSNSLKSDTVEGGYSASFSTNRVPATSANAYFPSTSSLYRSGITVEPGSSSMTVQSANLASSATPSYTREFSGIYPGTMQNHLQSTVNPDSRSISLPYPSGAMDNISSISFPNSIPYSNTPAFGAEQYPISSDLLSSLPANIPASPFYSSYPDMSANGALAVGKSAFDSAADGSVHSSLSLLSSIADSSVVNAPLSKLQPNLPTLDQLRHPRQPLASSIPFTRPDEKHISAFSLVSSNLSSSVPPTLRQQPLLPPQQPRHSLPDYTEEFDFEAMNEKFKKEEVWGYLGRAKQRVEGMESMKSAIDQNFELGGGYVSTSEPEPKPAYKKDDFFDTLSGNVHFRAPRNGQNIFPGRMKHNTEAFGDFRQTPYLGRGFYHHARGRGWNHRM